MKLLTGLIVALMTATAVADEKYDLTGRWGVGFGAGMLDVADPKAFTEGASELDSKLAASLWLRYHMTSAWGVEFSYTRLMYEYTNTAAPFSEMDPANSIFDASLAYRLFAKKSFHVLLQAGLGYVRYSDFDTVNPDNVKEDVALKGRIGLEYMLTPDLMVALQTDYYRLNFGSDGPNYMSVWAPMFALTYYFGKANAAGDTPAPAVTGPTDADADGVMDADDRCPGTPVGQKVTAYGCAETEKLEISLNVQFAPGKTVVDPKFTEDLAKFAEFLNKYPTTKAQIEGHTDNTGAEKLNNSISQKRADAVKKYLVTQYQVDGTRLTAKGFGPSQPIADNSTPEGREKNRRVVAQVQTEVPAAVTPETPAKK